MATATGTLCDYRFDPESRCDGVYGDDARCDQCGRPSIFHDYDFDVPEIQGQARPC